MNNIKQLELNKFWQFGITYEKICDYDVICFPENLDKVSNMNELFDASDSLMLSKQLKKIGVICANSFDLNLNISVLERRSDDKWYGKIFIRNNIIFPLLVNILGTLTTNSISDSIRDRGSYNNKIHIEMITEKPDDINIIKYDGDAQTFIKILQAINDNTNTKK
jgi:hypothetical protein